MKFTILILTTLISLTLAIHPDPHVCSILYDRYDRAAMYSRNFLVGDNTRWPNATIPYKISPEFTSTDVVGIKKAMRLLEGSSCVTFVEFKGQKNYLNIITGGTGCYANLGFNIWRQSGTLHLQRGTYCMQIGTIQHEMMHTLGFVHEHTRPDRDQYVKIDWSKLSVQYVNNWFRAGGEHENPLPPVCDPNDPNKNFDKCYIGFRTTTFGLDYDYGSVMHYGLRAGSHDGSFVMTALKSIPSGITVGQRNGPTVLDFNKINRAYPCNINVTTPETTTTEKPCKDFYSNCSDLEKYCPFMKEISKGCEKTCGVCGSITTVSYCFDRYTNCGDLTKYCLLDSNVRTGCPRSCGLCKNKPEIKPY